MLLKYIIILTKNKDRTIDDKIEDKIIL